MRDVPVVDLEASPVHDRRFSLRRLLSEFRMPLLARAGARGPGRPGRPGRAGAGQDGHRQRRGAGLAGRRCFAASAIYLFVALADLVDEIGETFVTGRAAQRIMLSLRIRIWAQLQRLSLDYYEREMAGRIMTRMTTDVDQFESLIENGLLSALVAMVTFVGVGVALVVHRPRAGALHPHAWSCRWPSPPWLFRRQAARALRPVAGADRASSTPTSRRACQGCASRRPSCTRTLTEERFHRLGRDYLESRVAAQRLVATYFPFVQFLSGVADAIVLGVGAGLVGPGQLTSGALIAFILYIDMFFSPIQQLSQVFDSWQQTRVSVRRIAELMQLETRTPAGRATRWSPGG